MIILVAADFDNVIVLEIAENEVMVAEKWQWFVAASDVSKSKVGDFFKWISGGLAVPMSDKGVIGDDGEVVVKGAKDGFDC